MSSPYAVPTEIPLGATGAPSLQAPVDQISHPLPIHHNPPCASSTDEWVPTREAETVPARMAELCLTCEGREQCLLWACLEDAPGYWAATTRRARRAAGNDIEQLLEQPTITARARSHPIGAGTIYSYRKGCDCDECRAANATAKVDQRQRAKRRRAAELAAAGASAA